MITNSKSVKTISKHTHTHTYSDIYIWSQNHGLRTVLKCKDQSSSSLSEFNLGWKESLPIMSQFKFKFTVLFISDN